MSRKLTITEIAMCCHQANKAYCEAIGDNSQKDWHDAEAWQRESAVKGVEFILAKPDAPDSSTHNAWMEEKKAAGWVWGPVKNAEKKEHPCIVHYSNLPLAERRKDALFKAVVNALKN